MFTLSTGNNIRQRQTPSQPLSHSVPYRQQDYHPSSNSLAPHPLSTAANSSSSFADHSRPDFYSETGQHLYTNDRDADDVTPRAIDSRELLSRTTNPNQPYDRSTTGSSDFPLSAQSPNQRHHQYGSSARPGYPGSSPLRRREIPDILDNFTLEGPYTSFYPESSVPVIHTSEISRRSDLWPNNTSPISQHEAPPKIKKRREKPRIELAPDQPPTTQGKPRARVYVACLQW